MINRILLIVSLAPLFCGCGKSGEADVIAKAGNRTLTREEFRTMTGVAFDSMAADERTYLLNEWLELAMLEQEIEKSNLRKDPVLARKERELIAQYYRAVLLARQPVPEITDSLISQYYSEYQSEFKRPSDSYLIESFYCEAEDSLKAFRRALERADTSRLKSGFVIWEGKWLADGTDLEPPQLAAVRAIQAGGLTPVLPFGEGYRLIRLHEVYPQGAQLSLEAVRGEIRERLLTEQSQRRQERWESELRSRYQPMNMGEAK
ncbi:peptidyl-prolyl cis-trans isomerase [bacterium]|nr:peptidyl-prolyl cis-trans isomerase [bacterium]